MMPTSSNLDVWRFLGFGSSIIGFSCFALGPSFQELFGQWNLLKIVLYCTVSFMFSVSMLFVKHIRGRVPRVFWLKPQVGFLVLMLTSLYSNYEDRSKPGKTEETGYQSILRLISFGAFALMSMSLSAQIQPGFEVGMSNFFLGCLVVGVMKISFKFGVGMVVLCYVVMSIRSYSDSQQQLCRRGGDALHEIVVVGDRLHEETPTILSPRSIHVSHSTLRRRSANLNGRLPLGSPTDEGEAFSKWMKMTPLRSLKGLGMFDHLRFLDLSAVRSMREKEGEVQLAAIPYMGILVIMLTSLYSHYD